MNLTSEEQVIVGFLVGAAGYSLLSSNQQQQKKPLDYHYFIGPMFFNLKINGVVATSKVLQDFGKREGTFIQTVGLYDMINNQSAEILFASPDESNEFAKDKGDTEKADVVKRGGDVDLFNMKDGIYCVPNGMPLHRFNMPIITSHTYQRVILEHNNFTEYIVHDLTTGQNEHWESHYYLDNRWSKPSKKYYNPGNEWWLADNYIDLSLLEAYKRWDIRDVNIPKSIILSGGVDIHNLPSCSLSNRCVMYRLHPITSKKNKRECWDNLTGRNVACSLFDTNIPPIPTIGFGIQSTRDNNIQRFFT